ncbi:ferritin-like domain-containing protein [Spiractinospora alimapuensis]|uniref:ferritin-like domain-containing protein n=1 Tax=Spiractinospora alimapuensis TaxID=2820884 RepID=UPI001F3067D9|nr:ferritin-like domain-containing protein [Spiractinospora alimapuensis]QVQ53665.1 ferritin-like domain-containing protein [Spiractinospora alimapuensis]
MAAEPAEPPEREAALQQALAAEHAAVHGYGFVGAHSVEGDRTRSRWHRDAHRRQRDELRDALLALDATPVPSESAYPPPESTDATALSDFAMGMEERCSQAYLELSGVADPWLRELAARNLAEATIRALAWGAELPTYPGFADDSP